MIEKKYAYHTPPESAMGSIQSVHIAFSNINKVLKEVCPESREKAVALTNLEQAAIWAIKAIVINNPASVAQE